MNVHTAHRLLTPAEVAALAGVSRKTVYREVQCGELRGLHAGRQLPDRTGRVGLSFGYLTVKSRKRGEVTDLLELDLFEISIAPSPANPQTRILEMKSAAITERELRRRCDEIALEAALGWEPITACGPGAGTQVDTDRHRAETSCRRGRSPAAAAANKRLRL